MAPLLQKCSAMTAAGLFNLLCGAGKFRKLWEKIQFSK
jgi:hypothetical protein